MFEAFGDYPESQCLNPSDCFVAVAAVTQDTRQCR